MKNMYMCHLMWWQMIWGKKASINYRAWICYILMSSGRNAKIKKQRHLNRDPKQDKAETSVYLGEQCALLGKESATYPRVGLVSNIQDFKSSKSVKGNKQEWVWVEIVSENAKVQGFPGYSWTFETQEVLYPHVVTFTFLHLFQFLWIKMNGLLYLHLLVDIVSVLRVTFWSG